MEKVFTWFCVVVGVGLPLLFVLDAIGVFD